MGGVMRKLLLVTVFAIIAMGMIAAPASACFFMCEPSIRADCEGFCGHVNIYNANDLGLQFVWEVKLYDTSDNEIASAGGTENIPYESGHPVQSFDFCDSWGMELCGTYYAIAKIKIINPNNGNATWVNYYYDENLCYLIPQVGGVAQEYTFQSVRIVCDCGGCTLTPGYWKNHPEAWPVDTIECGGSYSKRAAIALLDTAPQGDKWVIMVQHFIAAYLNTHNGTNDSCIRSDLIAACRWLNANKDSRPVRSWGDMEDVKDALDDYNNGRLGCADHCEDGDGPGIIPIAKPAKLPKVNNFPNPFNPITTLEFTLPEAGFARVEIYNMLGERIDTLVERTFQAGTYTVEWDASSYASGTYFYRLSTESHSIVQKILFVK